MPKLKTGTILLTPAEDAAITAAAMSDPDAVPFTDAECSKSNHWFAVAARWGSGSKTQVTLRLDVDVVEKFSASGDGWQTRINDALKSWVRTHS